MLLPARLLPARGRLLLPARGRLLLPPDRGGFYCQLGEAATANDENVGGGYAVGAATACA